MSAIQGPPQPTASLDRVEQAAAHSALRTGVRADIDGLRAIAVTLVVAFHAAPGLVSGGFVGVDAFFVISGFLITSLILRDLRDGSFSIVEFYIRRIRRIFPALAIVTLACLLAAWPLLLRDEFRKLSTQVLAGAGFVANILFWRQSGYFDDDSTLKPMLHLWSLGVEEQFYIGWPLLLFLFFRFCRQTLPAVLVLLVLSFGASICLIDTQRGAAFFLPLPRFWELMVGAALACVPDRWHVSVVARQCCSVVGLVLLLGSAFVIEPDSSFPGYWAALPVIGSALLLAAGSNGWVNRRLLSVRQVRYVGWISYPLYMWHWPILSLAAIVRGRPLSGFPAAIAISASVVLAALTYRFVEYPIRRLGGAAAQRRSALALVAAMMLISALALSVRVGLVAPLAERFPGMSEVASATEDLAYRGDVTLSGTSTGRTVMLGDSHMQQYWPRVEYLFNDHGRRTRTVQFHTRGGCAPVPGIERSSLKCAAFVAEGLLLSKTPEVNTVVIAASWQGFVQRGDYRWVGHPEGPALDLLSLEAAPVFDQWADSLRELHALGKRVVIVLSSPRGAPFEPKKMVNRGWLDFRFASQPVALEQLEAGWAAIEDRVRAVALKAGAEVINPRDFLCVGHVCPVTFDDGRPISTDGSHLRAAYVRQRVHYLDLYILASP